jgi:hypothetical protein
MPAVRKPFAIDISGCRCNKDNGKGQSEQGQDVHVLLRIQSKQSEMTFFKNHFLIRKFNGSLLIHVNRRTFTSDLGPIFSLLLCIVVTIVSLRFR